MKKGENLVNNRNRAEHEAADVEEAGEHHAEVASHGDGGDKIVGEVLLEIHGVLEALGEAGNVEIPRALRSDVEPRVDPAFVVVWLLDSIINNKINKKPTTCARGAGRARSQGRAGPSRRARGDTYSACTGSRRSARSDRPPAGRWQGAGIGGASRHA